MMGGRVDVCSTPGKGSTFGAQRAVGHRAGPAEWTMPKRREDVLLAVGSDGLQRHLRALLNEIGIEPIVGDGLPDGTAVAGQLLLVDAPLLQGLADVPGGCPRSRPRAAAWWCWRRSGPTRWWAR